jgi:hypothetical protein
MRPRVDIVSAPDRSCCALGEASAPAPSQASSDHVVPARDSFPTIRSKTSKKSYQPLCTGGERKDNPKKKNKDRAGAAAELVDPFRPMSDSTAAAPVRFSC